MIKDILTVPEHRKFLSTKCTPVDIETELDAIVTDLMDTSNSLKSKAAGISANQIGYQKRAFTMKFGDRYIVIINPEFVEKSRETKQWQERCLSIPGVASRTIRHKWIKVRWYCPEQQKTVKRRFKGMDAVIFQHEFDHGEGVLI